MNPSQYGQGHLLRMKIGSVLISCCYARYTSGTNPFRHRLFL